MELALKPTPQEVRFIEHKLSIRQTSELTGLSIATIHNLENHEREYNIRIDVAEAFAETFGKNVDDITWPKPLSTRGRPPFTTCTNVYKSKRTAYLATPTRQEVIPELLCEHCFIVQTPVDGLCSCCGN